MGWGSWRGVPVALGLLVVLAMGCGAVGGRGSADVLEATRIAPDSVRLLVASCNQGPFVDEVERTEPGTYEVRVGTRIGGTGDDCADLVSVAVDPDLATLVIVDRVSGRRFELLGTGLPAPLGLNGVWRMTTVDIGTMVSVGQTTAEIPELSISVDEESGVVEGNFGCNDLRIEVDVGPDTIAGRPETLTGGTERCPVGGGSGDEVVTERSLLELLTGGRPADLYLDGDHLELSTPDTNAVFERIAP
ncbi:MAG: hypothetical protein AAGA93_14895 [Actinomycetota bacterium]